MSNAMNKMKNLANVGHTCKARKKTCLVNVYANVDCHHHLLIEYKFPLYDQTTTLIDHLVCGVKKTQALKPNFHKIY